MTTYSRVRYRNNPVNYTFSGFYTDCAGGYTGPHPPMDVQRCTFVRSFEDNPHSQLDSRPAATACHDVWLRIDGYHDTTPFFGGGGAVHSTSGPWPISKNAMDAMVLELRSFAGGVDGGRLARILTSLLSQLPPELSLGNFLLELREADQLIPSLVQHWLGLQKGRPDRWKDALNGITREGRTLEQTAADVSLWWQFGVAPFLQDLDRLTNLGKSVGDRLEELRKHDGRTSARRVGPQKVDILPAAPQWLRFAWDWPWVPNHALEYRLTKANITYRGSAKLVSRLVGLEDWEGITAAWLAATGLNNPIAIVYEALPFSFVLDWFVPIGSRLQRVGAKPIAGTWDVSDACWTRLVEMEMDLRIRYWNSCSGSFSEVSCGTATFREFIRDTVFPDFPFSWPLTAGQAELGLALAIGASH